MTIKDLAATATLSRKKESCGKIALKRWKKKVISNAAVLGTSPSSVVWINADLLYVLKSTALFQRDIAYGDSYE